jgi:hypothetical protein
MLRHPDEPGKRPPHTAVAPVRPGPQPHNQIAGSFPEQMLRVGAAPSSPRLSALHLLRELEASLDEPPVSGQRACEMFCAIRALLISGPAE